MIDTPNPGSDEATKAGCLCAVIDNGHGRGYMGQPGIFVISRDCPLHGEREAPAEPREAPLRRAP